MAPHGCLECRLDPFCFMRFVDYSWNMGNLLALREGVLALKLDNVLLVNGGGNVSAVR